jgi:hypothetical protein
MRNVFVKPTDPHAPADILSFCITEEDIQSAVAQWPDNRTGTKQLIYPYLMQSNTSKESEDIRCWYLITINSGASVGGKGISTPIVSTSEPRKTVHTHSQPKQPVKSKLIYTYNIPGI